MRPMTRQPNRRLRPRPPVPDDPDSPAFDRVASQSSEIRHATIDTVHLANAALQSALQKLFLERAEYRIGTVDVPRNVVLASHSWFGAPARKARLTRSSWAGRQARHGEARRQAALLCEVEVASLVADETPRFASKMDRTIPRPRLDNRPTPGGGGVAVRAGRRYAPCCRYSRPGG